MSILSGKKTYIGIIIAALPTVAGLFGYTITVAGAAELGGVVSIVTDNIEAIIVAGGTLFAAYGRLVTKS